MIKKIILGFFIFVTSLTLSFASTIPSTVRVIIPYGAGGIADNQVRHLQEHLSRQGITLVFDYRPGANSSIAAQNLINSPADGSVIMINSTSNSYLAEKRLNQTVVVPIISTGTNSSVGITYPGSKFENFEVFIKSLKDNDLDLKIGWHSVNTLINIHQLVDIVSAQLPLLVPYRTSTDSSREVVGKHLSFAIVPYAVAKPLIDADNVVPVFSYASNNSNFRVNSAVPLRNRFSNWSHGEIFFYGLHPNTPESIQKAWFDILNNYLRLPETRKYYSELFFTVEINDKTQVNKIIESQGKLFEKYNIEIK